LRILFWENATDRKCADVISKEAQTDIFSQYSY